MISRARALRDGLLCGAVRVIQSPFFYVAAAALLATSVFAQSSGVPAGALSSRQALDHAAAAAEIAADAERLRAQARASGDLDAMLPGAQQPSAEALDDIERMLATIRPDIEDAVAELARSMAEQNGSDQTGTEQEEAGQASAETGPLQPPARDAAPAARYLVFASEAVGAGALAAIDALAAARGDMEVVFRGVGEGESIDAFAARRLAGRDAAPATIDPRPFREHGVDVAPAVLDRDTGVLVFGVGDPDALAGRDHGERLGPVVAIAEPDLAEVMKARALAIDWNARMTASVDSWLRRARFERLTPAPQDRVRRIDARVVLAEDFVLRDGRVIAHAGDTFDPTAVQPLSLTLIAFDPRKPAEVDAVADLLPGIAQPILMATEIDPVEGWDTFARLRARLGHPVYLLMPDVRSRFSLRHTVSVVSGGAGWFEVREIAAHSAASAEVRP